MYMICIVSELGISKNKMHLASKSGPYFYLIQKQHVLSPRNIEAGVVAVPTGRVLHARLRWRVASLFFHSPAVFMMSLKIKNNVFVVQRSKYSRVKGFVIKCKWPECRRTGVGCERHNVYNVFYAYIFLKMFFLFNDKYRKYVTWSEPWINFILYCTHTN